MTTKSGELAQGNPGAPIPSPDPQPQPQPETQLEQADKLSSKSGKNSTVFKSGPLFVSSKGIGWTSWKKRWFLLNHTSLVFFRSDPNKTEVNVPLGGIDLNNIGSVIIQADKKLLTVQFPNAGDGRAITFKAETTEDLYEWKTALEDALALASNGADAKNDQSDSIDGSSDQLKDKEQVKSTVTGRPILLALEDVDGTPSFLEKALRFIEEHGVKVEGILRQAADVELVEQRVREYEQGKVEFSEDEDAHVIGDCIKHVLREMASPPIPASCCKALLEACRTARVNRVSAMRAAISDTFPEPNRCLLQRILIMMQTVASFKNANKMSSSAVSACMAPLLLRPLLAGECEIENDFDVGGDGSAQLLQAAAAANHAQAIVITLLEEYDNIFEDGSLSPGPDMYTDSDDESESESEGVTDDDMSYDDDDYDDEEDESIKGSDLDEDDDLESETGSEAGDSTANDEDEDEDDDEEQDHSSSTSECSEKRKDKKLPSKTVEVSNLQHENIKSDKINSADEPSKVDEKTRTKESNAPNPSSCMKKSISINNIHPPQRRTVLGRTSARKNLSMESITYVDGDEVEIEKLEDVKSQNRIAKEGSGRLQSNMGKRKEALRERRLALEQRVTKLLEQLKKEKSYREGLQTGLKGPLRSLSDLSSIDEKAKAEFEELVLIEEELSNLEQKVDELAVRLNKHLGRNYGSTLDSNNQPQQILNHEGNLKNKPDTEIEAISQSQRSIIKDNDFSGAENEDERKKQSKSLPVKSSKKSSSRGEGGTSSTSSSPLTKLTSKLNFSKHTDNNRELSSSPRSQEKGRGGQLHPPMPSPKKSRGFEFYLPLPSPSKMKGGFEFHLPLISPSKSRGHGSLPHPEKLTKSDSQPGHHPNRQQYLRRGRSEGHHQPIDLENIY